MAEKESKKAEKKSKADKKREKYIYFMALLVIATMLFSGLYFLGYSGGELKQPENPEGDLYYNTYNVMPIGNMSMIVTAEDVRPELIAIATSPCISPMNVRWVYNASVPGLRNVVLDVGNPSSGYGICAQLLMFRFSYEEVNETVIANLEKQLANRLGGYSLKRGYVGLLPGNLSGPGTDKIYIIGSSNIKKGDKATIFMFQKQNDYSIFALERNRIPVGPTVPAKVLEVAELAAQATLSSDYDFSDIGETINITEIRIYPPKLAVNGTLDNKTVEELSGLQGVHAENTGQGTQITFNDSLKDVEDILARENATYSLENGSVILKMPLNTSMSEAGRLLADGGAKDVEFRKIGLVDMPQEIMINGVVVPIQDAGRFMAVLDVATKAGDRINISVSTFQFGDQIAVMGGSQTK